MSRLWDFNTDTPDVPDSSAITDALAYVDYTKVSLSTDNDGTHHISATGYPYDNNLCDVTIISSESTVGDCLSTTCFVLGLDDGMKLINSLEGIEAVFMTNDGSKYYSDNAKAYIN